MVNASKTWHSMTIDDREFAIGIPKRRSVLSHYTISPDDRQSALSSQEREPSRLCVLLVATDCSLSDSVRSAVRRDGDCSPSFRRRVFATARELASDALRDTAGGGVGVVARSSPAGGAEAKAGERSPFTKYVSIRPFPYASIARATHVSQRSAAQQMDRSERPGTAYVRDVERHELTLTLIWPRSSSAKRPGALRRRALAVAWLACTRIATQAIRVRVQYIYERRAPILKRNCRRTTRRQRQE